MDALKNNVADRITIQLKVPLLEERVRAVYRHVQSGRTKLTDDWRKWHKTREEPRSGQSCESAEQRRESSVIKAAR